MGDLREVIFLFRVKPRGQPHRAELGRACDLNMPLNEVL